MKTLLLEASIDGVDRAVWAEILEESHSEIKDGNAYTLTFRTRTYGFVPTRDEVLISGQRLLVSSVESDGESKFWTIVAESLGDSHTNQFERGAR